MCPTLADPTLDTHKILRIHTNQEDLKVAGEIATRKKRKSLGVYLLQRFRFSSQTSTMALIHKIVTTKRRSSLQPIQTATETRVTRYYTTKTITKVFSQCPCRKFKSLRLTPKKQETRTSCKTGALPTKESKAWFKKSQFILLWTTQTSQRSLQSKETTIQWLPSLHTEWLTQCNLCPCQFNNRW